MGLYLGQPSKSYSILPLPMSSSFTGSSSMDLYLHWPIIDMNFIKFFHFFFHECFIIMGFHCSLKALSTWTWLTKIVLLLSYFLGLVSQNKQWALEDLLIACLFFFLKFASFFFLFGATFGIVIQAHWHWVLQKVYVRGF